jgi:hypothetical protein
MKRSTATRLWAAGLIVSCLTASAQAADATGTWKWKFTTQGGQEFELSLALKQEGDKLTGALTLPMGQSVDIKDGAIKNDELNFQIVFERDGNSVVTKYQGKLEGDTIKGKTERERNGEKVTRDWEAKREK